MEVNVPNIFIKGIDKVIKKDLAKHKDLKIRCKANIDSFRTAVSHQVKKKKYYSSLIGGEKFDDNSLRKSMDMIMIDIRHLSDKVSQEQKAIDHHSLIIDTLTKQLEEYYISSRARDEYFRDAIRH